MIEFDIFKTSKNEKTSILRVSTTLRLDSKVLREGKIN